MRTKLRVLPSSVNRPVWRSVGFRERGHVKTSSPDLNDPNSSLPKVSVWKTSPNHTVKSMSPYLTLTGPIRCRLPTNLRPSLRRRYTSYTRRSLQRDSHIHIRYFREGTEVTKKYTVRTRLIKFIFSVYTGFRFRVCLTYFYGKFFDIVQQYHYLLYFTGGVFFRGKFST